MKAMKVSFAVLVALLMAMGVASQAQAFHSGGVAECEGCHTMHNSLDGQAMSTTGGLVQYTAGPNLLQGTQFSSVCLNCHQAAGASSYHISSLDSEMPPGTAPINRTPGGDFGWLKKTYTFLVRGGLNTNEGDRHGHNIIANDFGYNIDATLSAAPGGVYLSSNLTCISCHDPHGKYRRTVGGTISTTTPAIARSGSYTNNADPTATAAVGVYRLLGGVGYTPKYYQSVPFTNTVPVAVSPSTYNRSEGLTQTRVAYGGGMSEWCLNCHPGMSGNAGVGNDHRHPAGNNAVFSSNVPFGNYNTYVKSGDVSGVFTTLQGPYTSLVPFEEGLDTHTIANYTTLKAHALNTAAASTIKDADASSNVSCLSCHRAHASGFASMLRFGHENEFMTVADAGGLAIYGTTNVDNAVLQGLSSGEQQAAYYDRPAATFAANQRLLCNKCHVKD